MTEHFNEDISSLLGNKVQYNKDYDPDILVREKRSNNRVQYEIKPSFPFVGRDIWNCYEISFLLENGLPVTATTKLVYDCKNEYIVESKSLKLYLNSYNMFVIKGSKEEAVDEFKRKVKGDLEKLLETSVEVNLFFKEENKSIFQDYVNICNLIDTSKISFSSFKEDPSLLQQGNNKCFKIKTSMLRSNCKITNQSDGAIYLYTIKERRGLI